MTRILLLQFQVGDEERAMEERAYREASGPGPIELSVAYPTDGPLPPSLLDSADGMVIGGSILSVLEPIPHYRKEAHTGWQSAGKSGKNTSMISISLTPQADTTRYLT
ncbi:hypothetical protein JW899_03315 [Candidatus Uhrbacteria bacterium]|nr:hypothetical protein [Candidatus Uhrbacteria bacterium]